jgi:hypothetical protein
MILMLIIELTFENFFFILLVKLLSSEFSVVKDKIFLLKVQKKFSKVTVINFIN